jgi:hypothetical protein
MATPLAASPELTTRPRRIGRSTIAILTGFITIVVLSIGVDQVLHVLAVYPPWGQPMYDPTLNALALSYRIVISVLGCYITARLAPRAPMRHALILGAIGIVVSAAGTLAAVGKNLGPMWYPLALVVVSLPCAWLGGRLYVVRQAGR